MGDLRILFRSYLKETSLGKYLRRKRSQMKLGDRRTAEKMIEKYVQEDLSVEKREALIADMIRMQKTYRYGYDEYFLYGFPERTDAERLEFVADLDRIDTVESLNKAINQPLFDDKARTFAKYGKYYQRNLCCVGGGMADFEKLKEFLLQNQRIIIKPADSSCGNGVQILDVKKITDVDETVKTVLKSNARGLVAEEVIIQDARMGKLHPSSVNTLRVTTLRLDDRIEVIHPFLKIGRGGAVVDNGGAGGILCVFDPVTGEVTHTGDELGRKFEVHPETGEKIIGFTIPRWEEAIAFVKELAMITPSNRYTGWDLALTEKGWILVEANARGQFVGWQIPTQIGFKRELCGLLLEISKKRYSGMVAKLMRDNL